MPRATCSHVTASAIMRNNFQLVTTPRLSMLAPWEISVSDRKPVGWRDTGTRKPKFGITLEALMTTEAQRSQGFEETNDHSKKFRPKILCASVSLQSPPVVECRSSG
jgi:hypothetical protein